MTEAQTYRLEEQVGFVLRQAQQRHTTLFSELMVEDLTPTQWAALARLAERGPQSQNQLGRLIAMDAATIKGVIERLTARGFTETRADPEDARRLLVELSMAGSAVYERAVGIAAEITERTLSPLSGEERTRLLELLQRIT